ncbi:MAG: SRPBCC domain-containing protein [Sediminicola sp.]|tara:strand:- start:13963 stop:14391 length:429 start_codon:yes stop_codon:yes gene_type:complete
MEKELVVRDQIKINATPERVWEVLTKTEYYRQWDDVPEDFTGDSLQLDSVMEWKGYSKLTVVEYEPNKTLKLSLFLPKVADSISYDISYTYTIRSCDEDKTLLGIQIGDFSPLPNAEDYYEASLEFFETAKDQIKTLAEKGQ